MSAGQASPKTRKLATRKSPLALWQARRTVEHLGSLGYEAQIQGTTTTGDRLQKRALSEERVPSRAQEWHTSTGKGLFIKEVQDLIYDGQCDLAVHSLKDLPLSRSPGLQIAGFLPAASPEDVLVTGPQLQKDPRLGPFLKDRAGTGPSTAGTATFWRVLEGALRDLDDPVIGTTSRRRQALVRAHGVGSGRLQILRGNVDSRLERVAKGEFAFILLARAGLERLGLYDEKMMIPLPTSSFTPACAQGVVAIETRNDDADLSVALYQASDKGTLLRICLERTILHLLEGDCHSIIGIHLSRHPGPESRLGIFTAEVFDPEVVQPESLVFHHSDSLLATGTPLAIALLRLESSLSGYASFTELFEASLADEELCQALHEHLRQEGHFSDVQK